MNKRAFISLGAAGVLAAATATAVGIVGAAPATAASPWREAGKSDDRRLRALSYAILAPSAHNLQPWQARLVGIDEILILADPTRRLPQADPFDRQTIIGLGAFLELLSLAAEHDGYRAQITLFPEGDSDATLFSAPVAHVRLVSNGAATPEPLFDQVLARRSSKEPYDLGRPVPDTALTALQATAANRTQVGASSATDSVAQLRKLTAQAMLVELDSPAYEETVAHYRFGRREIDQSPDGIAFSGLLFETLILFGQFTRAQALDRSSSVYAQGRDKILSGANTAMAHIWVVTAGNSRPEQIAAGRDWVRINLAATALGLGIHPLSQALEEFSQMAETRKAVHSLLAREGGTVQMLARLGYVSAPGPTPRWPLGSKLVPA